MVTPPVRAVLAVGMLYQHRQDGVSSWRYLSAATACGQGMRTHVTQLHMILSLYALICWDIPCRLPLPTGTGRTSSMVSKVRRAQHLLQSQSQTSVAAASGLRQLEGTYGSAQQLVMRTIGYTQELICA